MHISRKSLAGCFWYHANRNIFGRSRISTICKAARLTLKFWWYRGTVEKETVVCWKCEEPHQVYKSSVAFYDNTKCGRCYL